MEQQTISVTKAGIHATMNAKTSVLAACNPVSGRYDISKPLFRNLNISAPILSRFDLVFILLDQNNEERDREVAESIVEGRVNQVETDPDVKAFINFAKDLKPVMTENARQTIVSTYRAMRESDSISVHNNKTTIRQLESLVRLSEAIAKFHLSEEVSVSHVNEASTLLRKSIGMIRKK